MRALIAILWFFTQLDLVLLAFGGLAVAVMATVSFLDPSVGPGSGDGRGQTTLGWIATVLIGLGVSAAACLVVLFARRAEERPAVKYACIGIVLGGPFVLMRPTVAPFVIIGLMLVLWWWEKRQIPPGHCRKCRYNLTGNVSGRCPECGTAVPIDDDSVFLPAKRPVPNAFEGHRRTVKIVIGGLLCWGALALCYVYTPWLRYTPETWLLRLRWLGSERAMTELFGRFGRGQLAPRNAKGLFDELMSVSVEAKWIASAGSVLAVTLHLRSAHLGEGRHLQFDELELSADGQRVPFKWKESHISSGRAGEEAALTYHVSGASPETRVITLRATASWRPGITGGLRPLGRPLKSKYGWLIEKTVTVKTPE